MLWRVPLAVIGIVAGVVVLLSVTAVCVIHIPSLRKIALERFITTAQRQTGLDIDAGQISLSIASTSETPEQINSPFTFHISPFTLYRAWKGKVDLPLNVKIDSVYFGHRGQDTLLYVRSLRLKAMILTSQGTDDLTDVPIGIECLQLDRTTIHSGAMIAAVGIDAIIGHLEFQSPSMSIAKRDFPIRGMRLSDSYIGIELRDTPSDSTAQDSSPMRFDIPDGTFRNVRFRLTPIGMDLTTRSLQTNVLADVGNSKYDVRRVDIGHTEFTIGNFSLPVDTLYGNAYIDLEHQLITSRGLHIRSEEMNTRVDLSATEMNLETMQVNVTADADFCGSKAKLRGFYNIDNEAYDLRLDVEKVNLSPFMQDNRYVEIAGRIDAEGKGINLYSQDMRCKLKMHFTDAIYDNINASGMRLDVELAEKAVEGVLLLPFAMTSNSLRVAAQTEHRFHVANFLSQEKDGFLTMEKIQVNYQSRMRNVKAHTAGEDFYAEQLDMQFTTDSATSLNLVADGLEMDVKSPIPAFTLAEKIQPLLNAVNDSAIMTSLSSFADMTVLDTLREKIPEIRAKVALRHGNPAQGMIDRKGLDIEKIDLLLGSTPAHTDLSLEAVIPEISHPEDNTAMRLPAAKANLLVRMTDGSMHASLEAKSRLTDGAMSLHGLKTNVDLELNLERRKNYLDGEGFLKMDSLVFGGMDLSSREVRMVIARSQNYKNSIKADVRMDDIPLDIADSILKSTDVDLNGAIRAYALIDGLPNNFDLSAKVLPLSVSAIYKPYNARFSLDDTPIVMNHNKTDFSGLSVYGADSTFLSMTGGLDLSSMRLDIVLEADSFVPVKLVKGDSVPFYGELATDIQGTVTGPLDSILADVDVTILPVTDITYQIDKKNLAQVKQHGMVNVRYALADSMPLHLGGQINVDEGYIRYSPKLYPIMPFHVDSGSNIAFNGSLGRTLLNISASQKVKADVQSEGEETRRVAFTTGVRVNGVIDSIGLKTIGFFLEAPDDETITRELASLDEETREGLAATLLATGMYLGESNVATQRDGYALSSIINSRINAAMANSKMGKVVDIDISNAQTEHAGGKTNDMNISISKSFFKDRFRITVGSTLTDNPDVNQTSGLLNNLSAEYKLTQDGNVLLRAFTQRDYNNIFEGELYKSGLGVQALKDWRRKELYCGDSITRTYVLTADAGVAYRSNNSIGPDATIKSSVKNLLGHGETFSIKGNCAYYWALRDRHPGDPKKTDTYKLGANASIIFPYLHWAGDNNPEGDTRYMLGYQYENIAGGYGVHKLTGSFSYFIHSSRYITHTFTPFSLSVVRMKAESDSLLSKAAEYPQLIKIIAGNEFVPSIGYNFIYNNYRSKRAVNTLLDLGFKESGNLINAIYCIFGHKWNELEKPLGSLTFNQFVKLTAELRNKFNFTEKVCIATRIFAGANIPLGNSVESPLSEAFYAGGPNGMRAASPYAYGAGNFYSEKYNHNFFHAGDIKLEANIELRFPIVWKLYGATFLDAGNVWNWYCTGKLLKEAGVTDYIEQLQLRSELYDGIMDNPELLRQIALGTGAGLRIDLDGLVIHLDLGVAIHAPYQTYKYDKDWNPDKSKPINTYFNIPSALDALRLNFGIGYPF